jgi:hypothetical protein
VIYEEHNSITWTESYSMGVETPRPGRLYKEICSLLHKSLRKPCRKDDDATSFRTSILGEHDLHFFNEGTHVRSYDRLGAQVVTVNNVREDIIPRYRERTLTRPSITNSCEVSMDSVKRGE